MLFPKELRLANYYLENIEKRGFDVTFSSNFVDLETAVANMSSEDCKVTPHFSTKVNTFARNEALWIGVWDGNTCIATIAAKLTRLDGEPLIDWITRYWQQTYGPGSENKFSLGQQQKTKLSKITGDTIYEGEFKIHKDYRARRETDNLELFRRMDGMTLSLALLLRVYCFTFWRSAEFQYAYMADHHANIGLGSKHWFTTQIPRALNWEQHPSQGESDYWLVGMDRTDYMDFVDQQHLELCAPKSIDSCTSDSRQMSQTAEPVAYLKHGNS